MFGFKKPKIDLPTVLISKLFEVDWFCNCGNTSDMRFISVSEKQAIELMSSYQWETTVLDFRGIVTETLSARERNGLGKEYREWNALVQNFKKKYSPQLAELLGIRLKEQGLDSDMILSNVQFSILAMVSVFSYSKIIEIPLFFNQLLEAYQAGYLPCGYDENSGKVIVF